jgi:hypothetical protein
MPRAGRGEIADLSLYPDPVKMCLEEMLRFSVELAY